MWTVVAIWKNNNGKVRLCPLPNGCIHLTIGEEDDFWLVGVQSFSVWNTVYPKDYHNSNDGDDSDTSGK